MELCSSYNFSDNKTTTALSCSQALWRIINMNGRAGHICCYLRFMDNIPKKVAIELVLNLNTPGITIELECDAVVYTKL